MTDLAALLARVEGASGPDREIDIAISKALNYSSAKWERYAALVTASIDAAAGLANAVLPGWCYEVAGYHETGAFARVWPNTERCATAEGPTPALALVAAIIRAKMGEAG